MTETTKNYPTEVLLSISTGVLLCEFSKMQECCGFLMESPIWTHQFAHKPLCEKLKSAVLLQNPQLSNVNTDGVNSYNWRDFRDRIIEQFGPELPLTPLRLCSDQELQSSFTEPLKGKNVIAVGIPKED